MNKSLDSLDIATPSDTGTEIELLHPISQEALGIFIKITGRHSEVYAKQRRKIEQEQIAATKNLKEKDRIAAILDGEDTRRRGVSLLACCVIGWYRMDGEEILDTLHFEGQEHKHSLDATIKLLSSRKWVWLYDQIDKAVHDDTLFMKP